MPSANSLPRAQQRERYAPLSTCALQRPIGGNYCFHIHFDLLVLLLYRLIGTDSCTRWLKWHSIYIYIYVEMVAVMMENIRTQRNNNSRFVHVDGCVFIEWFHPPPPSSCFVAETERAAWRIQFFPIFIFRSLFVHEEHAHWCEVWGIVGAHPTWMDWKQRHRDCGPWIDEAKFNIFVFYPSNSLWTYILCALMRCTSLLLTTFLLRWPYLGWWPPTQFASISNGPEVQPTTSHLSSCASKSLIHRLRSLLALRYT